MRWSFSMRRLIAAGQSRARHGARGEGGFTVAEALVGLGLVFTATLFLMGSLTTGIRGLLTGRQRLTATSVAKEHIEDLRRACYDRIGHDLDDATLATDDDLDDSSGTWVYQPTGEDLVGARTSSGCSGDAAVPVHHVTGQTRDDTPYEVWTYVTSVEPSGAGNGLRHKRITVVVRWDNEQYGADTIDPRIRLSTLVFEHDTIPGAGGSGGGPGGGTPQHPIIQADATVDAGTTTITGTLAEVGGSSTAVFDPMRIEMPRSYAFLRTFLAVSEEVTGWAKSPRTTVTETWSSPSPPPGCTQSGASITCSEVTASTKADDVENNGVERHDSDRATASSNTMSEALWDATFGGGSADSDSTVCAGHASCGGLAPSSTYYPADGNEKPRGVDIGRGDDLASVGFDLGGGIKGSLVGVGDVRGETDVEQDQITSSTRKTRSSAVGVYPATSLLSIANTDLLGYGTVLDVVSVSAFDMEAFAEIGPTSTGADCRTRAGAVTVTVLGPNGLTDIAVDCKTATNETRSGSVLILNPDDQQVGAVTTEVTITSKALSETEQIEDGEYRLARAELEDWLTITAGVTITAGGIEVFEIDVILDYGDLVAFAERTP